MTSWQIIMIAAFVLLEAGIIWFHRWMTQNVPEQALWVVLGVKALKLVLVAAAIAAVNFLTEIPLKKFCIWLIGCYVLSIVAESIFFLKKKRV